MADVHVHNFQRMDEYSEQLEKLRKFIEEDSKKFNKEECRIVISGDIVHSKSTISNELIAFVSTWSRDLEKICRVIVISGNHDQVIGNSTRLDTLSAIFTAAGFHNAIHLDSYFGYNSGIFVDDNITWALFSIFSDFKCPDIEKARKEHPYNAVVGVYHGPVIGSDLQNGQKIENGTDKYLFETCDCVMAGDIHKRQMFEIGKCQFVYPGSVIQQTFGETIMNHGIAVWDVYKKMDGGERSFLSFEFKDIESEYGLYNFEIKSPEDIDENIEVLTNLK